MRSPTEARILGGIDFEIRSLLAGTTPNVPVHLAKLWKPSPLVLRKSFPQLLNQARSGMSLSFRECEVLSRRISDVLADKRYRVTSSSLCDYEVEGGHPRSLHKLLTLCCVYGVSFRSLVVSMGIPLDHAGTIPMPDHLAGRFSQEPSRPDTDQSGFTGRPGFLERVLEYWRDIPLFLRGSIGSITGLRKLSANDFFWIPEEHQSLYPYVATDVLAAVNRRTKTPLHFPAKALWNQPVYLLQKREGDYLCACCNVENSTLVVHSYTEQVSSPLQFRYRKDIEVVGQIVAIARKIS